MVAKINEGLRNSRFALVCLSANFLQRRWPEAEMAAVRMRRHDPRLLLLAAYSMVTGMETEVDVLRAFGEEPTLRSLVHRRDELLSLLRAALEPGPGRP